MKILFPVKRSKSCGTIRGEWLFGLVALVAIFILLAMLLPVTPNMRRNARIVMARMESDDIAIAISTYKQQYGRYPIPTNVETADLAKKQDYTCGGPELASILGPAAHLPINADVITVLMDMTNFPDGQPTVNRNHNLNPQHIIFLNARLSGNTNGPGMGMDGVYRDPWGHPYIISLDLSGGNSSHDTFGINHLLSGNAGAIDSGDVENSSDANRNNEKSTNQSGILVWSLGPSK